MRRGGRRLWGRDPVRLMLHWPDLRRGGGRTSAEPVRARQDLRPARRFVRCHLGWLRRRGSRAARARLRRPAVAWETENQCGCTPKTCQALGAECGSISDGCDHDLACGTCPGAKLCGGAGANKCGDAPCEPKTCASAGAEVGSVSDGCDGVLTCGNCVSPKTFAPGEGPRTSAAAPRPRVRRRACIAGRSPTAAGARSTAAAAREIRAASTAIAAVPRESTCAVPTASMTAHVAPTATARGMNECSSPGAACSCRTSPARQAIYRSYSQPTEDHFFSPWQAEGPNAGYADEGVRFYDYAGPCQWGLGTFYRLRDPNSGEHFYTANGGEKDSLVGAGWYSEGDIGCIAPSEMCGAVPLFRLSTPGSKQHVHDRRGRARQPGCRRFRASKGPLATCGCRPEGQSGLGLALRT